MKYGRKSPLPFTPARTRRPPTFPFCNSTPKASGFTDYFVICSGSNPRQIQAIADDVDDQLSAQGLNPTHREGYNSAEWVLLDYVDFVVHIFSEAARKFYDLERLWKTATRLELSDLEKPARTPAKKAVPRKNCREEHHAFGSEEVCSEEIAEPTQAVLILVLASY